ncbi:hypothetical protein GCG54_00003624 [Colletotrichum gloeosporioides]|uniref:Major facilitator superfamily transporter n=1 Tax=Colletotrichum gloeosporioides TaxID=474922 RepID=A0A8H4CXX0_COLGL|nr:uncharacterized protein GCG54_00003624 [Colletotrichum gloeosporioides]KAF3811876.1 hypothetical protein GCG54_00003624 [Colletotrichum gloeosporioides]
MLMVVSMIPAFGLYLMTGTGRLPGLLIWTLFPSSFADRAKKWVTGTVTSIASWIGNAIGSHTNQAPWAPAYVPAMIVCGVMYDLRCVLFIAWGFYCKSIMSENSDVFENQRRDAVVPEMELSLQESSRQGQIQDESDVTDRENVSSRYSM